MSELTIYRYHPTTGELFVPHRCRDGCYRVADPALGGAKKLAANQIPVETDGELVTYLRAGFHLRMRGTETSQINLISPGEIMFGERGIGPDGDAASLTQDAPASRSAASHEVDPPKSVSLSAAASSKELLPPPGRLECSRCFPGEQVVWGETTAEREGWRLTNNPMAWGNRSAEVLVLGFSKGGRQNDEITSRPHDEVAFRGGRSKLATILETLTLKAADDDINSLIADRAGRFAFGSLVRCTVAKADRGDWLMTGKAIMKSCLAGPETSDVIDNCVATYLATLPGSVKLAVMLGNDLDYVDGCYRAIGRARPGLKRVNPVAYRDDQVTFVHTVHFAAQGRLVPEWAHGIPGRAARLETDQPLKRDYALAAVAERGMGLASGERVS